MKTVLKLLKTELKGWKQEHIDSKRFYKKFFKGEDWKNKKSTKSCLNREIKHISELKTAIKILENKTND